MEDAVAGETSHDLAQYTFNLPASPLAQSHKISEQQLEQDGYDSDAGLDPNDAVINEGPLECDEEDIQEVRFDSEAAAGALAAPNGGEFVDIPESQLTKLKVAELKQELAKRGQQVNGNKKVLLERLTNALRNVLEQQMVYVDFHQELVGNCYRQSTKYFLNHNMWLECVPLPSLSVKNISLHPNKTLLRYLIACHFLERRRSQNIMATDALSL